MSIPTFGKQNLRRVSAMAVTAFGLIASPALADTYVDKSSVGGRCDDTRTAAQASAVSTPWCSLSKAVAAAPPGSKVRVRTGDYPFLSVANSRSRTAYVTFAPQTGETVRVGGMSLANSTYLAFDGITVTSTVDVGLGSAEIRFANGSYSALKTAIVLQEGTSKVVVENNKISSPQGSGVFFSSGPGLPEIADVTIRGNKFDGIGVVGINARAFRNLLIEKNEITRVASWDGVVHPDAIRTYAGGTGLTVRSNFIHDNVAQGFFIKDGKVFNVVLENNIIVRTGGSFKDVNIYDVEGLKVVNNTFWGKGLVFQGTATGVMLRNNIMTNLTTVAATPLTAATENYNLTVSGVRRGLNDIAVAPKFVDPNTLDYRLAAGSPGIDAGTSDQAPLTDRLGTVRIDDPATSNIGGGTTRYYDMGAREFGSALK